MLAPYIYNSNVLRQELPPFTTSGPYWDHREIEAAIDAFLNGKWIVAGVKMSIILKENLARNSM